MGYLIDSGFIIKTVTILNADFENCGTAPALLLAGKPNMVFQLFSVMAFTDNAYTSTSPYTILGLSNEYAVTHFDNFTQDLQPCIYIIGSGVNIDNYQKTGFPLLVSTRSGVDPVGGGNVTFTIIYREIYV
jgi:hypothetical protein